jgi:hypothetical protein
MSDVLIYNILGQIVFSEKVNVLKGKNTFNLNGNLPNGVLIFQVKSRESGAVWSLKGMR